MAAAFAIVCGVACLIGPLVLHIAYKHQAPVPFMETTWSAGEALDYLGSILGAIATIGTVMLTIRFTREESAEEHRLGLMPYLNVGFSPEEGLSVPQGTVAAVLLERQVPDADDVETGHPASGVITLKNVGNGAAVSLEVQLREFDQTDSYLPNLLAREPRSRMTSVISPGSTGFISLCFSFNYPRILNENSDAGFSTQTLERCKSFDFFVDVLFEDILGNRYLQVLRLSIYTHIVERGGSGAYYRPELHLAEVGTARLCDRC